MGAEIHGVFVALAKSGSLNCLVVAIGPYVSPVLARASELNQLGSAVARYCGHDGAFCDLCATTHSHLFEVRT
jgi:hypothetical protein